MLERIYIFATFLSCFFYVSYSACDFPPGGTLCPFNDQCQCFTQRVTTVYCNVSDTFPNFTKSELSIDAMSFKGTFTTVPTDAFYSLYLSRAQLCFEYVNEPPTTLTTYQNTFRMQNADGINSLAFFGYSPVIGEDPSNFQYVEYFNVQYGDLYAVPPYLDGFTNLAVVFLQNNLIRNVSSDGFSFAALEMLDVSHNNVTFVDSGFSEWLLLNKFQNKLFLRDNPITCDSNAAWMANFAVCKPVQIYLGRINCTNEQTLVQYLTQYANCEESATTSSGYQTTTPSSRPLIKSSNLVFTSLFLIILCLL